MSIKTNQLRREFVAAFLATNRHIDFCRPCLDGKIDWICPEFDRLYDIEEKAFKAYKGLI